MEHEVLIIGGGLAGLVNAIHLSKAGLDVALVERKTYPFHKVCGEYISNEIKPYLEKLEAFPHALNPIEISRLQITTPKGKSLEAPLKMGGFSISRFGLDHYLYEKAKALGVKFYLPDTARSVELSNDKFQIELQKNGNVNSKMLIGAFGKRSLIDKKLDRSFTKKTSAYVAIKQHWRGDFPEDLVALHNFKGGYCGLSKVETGAVNLCYLAKDKDLKAAGGIEGFREKVLRQNPHLDNFLENAEPVFSKALAISQVSFQSKKAVEKGVFMCGDAAGMIFPLCGNGMAMAIHSAHICSDILLSFFKKELNRKEAEQAYQKKWEQTFSSRLKAGNMLQPLFGNPWLSEISLATLRIFPGIVNRIIPLTHGKAIS